MNILTEPLWKLEDAWSNRAWGSNASVSPTRPQNNVKATLW